MVAPQLLELLVKVRILARQPNFANAKFDPVNATSGSIYGARKNANAKTGPENATSGSIYGARI
jgi:hypothetical protein